jgi:glycosyltransferase involved in cell wall biosynthesis
MAAADHRGEGEVSETAGEAGLISSLTTVRNGEAYLREALDSLLAQTDDHFEVIVVDDGSSDHTQEILQEYHDPRLRVEFLPPVGRPAALLRAVAMARGEYLAVLDADDVALPHRLATQRAYLDSHPELALLGSRAVEFEGDWERIPWRPTGPAAVRRALGMYNPFYFSSVMFRRQVYQAVGGFRLEDGWSYDKAFLVRVTAAHGVDILPEPLIRYRRHPAQVSASPMWERYQRPRSAWLQLRAARCLGLAPYLWVFPLLGYCYACLPPLLRPRRLKDLVKRRLLERGR